MDRPLSGCSTLNPLKRFGLGGLTWPVIGQIVSTGAAALSAYLVFEIAPDEEAVALFAGLAVVALASALGGFGQRRLLPRDIRSSENASMVDLLRHRFRLVVGASSLAGLAVAAGVWQFEAFGSQWSAPVVVGVWIVAEALRGVAGDVPLGFLQDSTAAVVGDALRWCLHLVSIGSALVFDLHHLLLLFGAAASVVGFLVSASVGSLRIRLWQSERSPTSSSVAAGRGPLFAGALVASNSLAAMMASQLTVITAAVAFDDAAALDFAFGIRVAAGLGVVQAAGAKFVLPRATDLQTNLAQIRRTAAFSLVATVGLLGLVIGALAILRIGSSTLVLVVAAIGVGQVLNVAAGPAGTVLIAQREELPVFLSNFAFGLLAGLAPLFSTLVRGAVGAAVVVGLATAMHHGTNARILHAKRGATVGFWKMPALVSVRHSR